MNREIHPAVFRTHAIVLGSVVSPGEQRRSIIDVDGVKFISPLPTSVEECRRINFVASVIIASSVVPANAPLDVEF